MDFLYESGLSVGKGSTEVFKALQDPAPATAASAGTSSSKVSFLVPRFAFELLCVLFSDKIRIEGMSLGLIAYPIFKVKKIFVWILSCNC